ncbi:dynein axonemal assembly factor 3 homolog [Bactrocera neohumeralis]|uniref:dynein axonemal assembly factor 3 homolog n=1 Tax=Bactrocera neohumeralis TaxID=98809 RepID=UPI00216675B1|nr:dynein axonemal assembly factor 3 homolog [Bactrocera neohumeralis]
MFWGLSEALDLYQEYCKALKLQQPHEYDAEKPEEADEEKEKSPTTGVEYTGEAEERAHSAEGESDAGGEAKGATHQLNILLFGAGDPRHIIKTMAKMYQHKGSRVNIYVLDGCIEIVARNMLLLGIALENPESFHLVRKVHLFMDVYGNALMRPASHQYLIGKAKALLRMITDDAELKRLAPQVNIDRLRYRERDGLENAFNFLLPREGYVFNVQQYWTERVRKLLTTRYDYREGAFDWDLNMVLKDRNAAQICSQEYRYWRETGIAFTYPEYEQCKPNKTLVAGLVRNGEKYLHRGYAGDIETGPFCTFGLNTADKQMMNSVHGDNDYRATDITERNLVEYFHELQTRTAYTHDRKISRKYGSVKLLMGERLTFDECDVDAVREYAKPWIQVEQCKVFFLSADDIFTLQDVNTNENWRNFFDVVFVGHNYFPFLKSNFAEVLRGNALLILETKLLTVARKEVVHEFEDKLKSYAKLLNLTPVINYNALNSKNSILRFKKIIEMKKMAENDN